MVESVRATLRAALLSTLLPVLLAIAQWLSQRRGLPTPDEPCNLQNWGCSTGASLIGTLLLFGIPVVFPLLTVYVQYRLIWRSRTVLTVPQIVVSLAPAPLILSLVAVVLGARGEDELAVLAVLACMPTTIVAALQQVFIRRRLLRQEEPRPSSSRTATTSVHLFLACYALLLLIGTILTWGPVGKSWQQLVPGITLLLLFLTLCAGIYAAFALYFVVRSLTHPTLLGKTSRAISMLTGVIGVAVISTWGLLTALIQDEVVEIVTVGASTYLGTKGDYPPICYHSYDGGPLMERDCALAGEPGLGGPQTGLPHDLTDAPSPGLQSSQLTPQADGTPAAPNTSPHETVIASSGDFGVIQIGASLGQKGTYAFAQRSGGSWVLGTTIIEDATFTDFVRVHGILLAAFAPNPNFSLMVSSDDGRTWHPADLPSATVPEDMRYFHDLDYVEGTFTLTTGYPNWVDSDQTNHWTSSDCLTWEPLSQ